MLSKQIETITPEIASKLLAGNTSNRPISVAHVDHLASEMIEGRWDVTEYGIAVAEHGLLIDGQHRLHAVITSGRTVEMNVLRISKDPNPNTL